MSEPRDSGVGAGGGEPTAPETSFDESVIQALLAQGAHLEAARLCAQAGQTRRALDLFERLWRFSEAVPLALALGERARAVRLCLDARDTAQALVIAQQIPDDDAQELEAAFKAFAGRGRHLEAAQLAERAGRWNEAAQYFERAGSPLEAGLCLERAGRLHEAGKSLEAAVVASTGPREKAQSLLALAHLLGRLGRHGDAARSIQRAQRLLPPLASGGADRDLQLEAGRMLALELKALGFVHAAVEAAHRLKPYVADPVAYGKLLAQVHGAESSSPDADEDRDEGFQLHERFLLHRLLGQGATGRVYEADDRVLGQRVALKVLSLGAQSGAEPEHQAYIRYSREAEIAGRLKHPHIVALFDSDLSNGLFVFELMNGGTLRDRLAVFGPLPLPAARRLALDVLAGLEAAHEAGVVHRDIKPSNVYFDAAGNAKVGDFGAAHLLDFGQTQTGGFVGTVAYMSPEQIAGSAIGPGADLYALGVTLFEALTGTLPFAGPDLVSQHLEEPPPSARSRRSDLSAEQDETLAKALAKSPQDRFLTAREMAASVRRWPAYAAGPGRAAVPRVDSTEAKAQGGVGPAAGIAEPQNRPLGPTPRGSLTLSWDSRVARWVLVERLRGPLAAEEEAALRALAALGGPRVQRVLGFVQAEGLITYEYVPGPTVDWHQVSPDERPALEALRQRFDELQLAHGQPLGFCPKTLVQGPGGIVWVLFAALPPALRPDEP